MDLRDQGFVSTPHCHCSHLSASQPYLSGLSPVSKGMREASHVHLTDVGSQKFLVTLRSELVSLISNTNITPPDHELKGLPKEDPVLNPSVRRLHSIQ